MSDWLTPSEWRPDDEENAGAPPPPDKPDPVQDDDWVDVPPIVEASVPKQVVVDDGPKNVGPPVASPTQQMPVSHASAAAYPPAATRQPSNATGFVLAAAAVALVVAIVVALFVGSGDIGNQDQLFPDAGAPSAVAGSIGQTDSEDSK